MIAMDLKKRVRALSTCGSGSMKNDLSIIPIARILHHFRNSNSFSNLCADPHLPLETKFVVSSLIKLQFCVHCFCKLKPWPFVFEQSLPLLLLCDCTEGDMLVEFFYHFHFSFLGTLSLCDISPTFKVSLVLSSALGYSVFHLSQEKLQHLHYLQFRTLLSVP